MKKEININMFVVPNQGCRLDQILFHEDEEGRLERFGVPFHANSKCLQVWCHCDEEDNLTDHGLTDSICDALGIPEGRERFYVYAPNMFPVAELEKVNEGGTLTYTTKNGCVVNIKCEQLPYRYGRFGKFEEVVAMVSRNSERNIAWLDEMAARRAEKKGA